MVSAINMYTPDSSSSATSSAESFADASGHSKVATSESEASVSVQESEDFDDEYASTDDDDDQLLLSGGSKNSNWRKHFKQAIKAEKRQDASQERSGKNLFGGPSEFGSAHNNDGDGAASGRQETSNVSSAVRLLNRMNAAKEEFVVTPNGTKRKKVELDALLNASFSSGKLAAEDVSELQNMFEDEDDDDDDGSAAPAEAKPPSYRAYIASGTVKKGREIYESMNRQTSPQQSDGNSAPESEEFEDEPDEETQLMILQRRAEKARGDPSNYHSSDDEDEPLFDLQDKGDNSSDEEESDDEESDDDDDDDTSDSSAIIKQSSSKWEASVASEDNNLGSSVHSGGNASFRRQKELRNSGRSLSNRSMNLDSSDHSAGNNASNRNAREDLEAQVKARFESEHEDVKRQLQQSIHRGSSHRMNSSLAAVEEEGSSSLVLSLEFGGDTAKRNQEDKMTLDVAPPIAEEDEVKKSGPFKKLSDVMTSWAYIYFLAVFIVLLLAANAALIYYFVQAMS
mmetsp:Transcript_8713/g.13910  ORF Transcript_8713/g.13910 Transcript_8713/m.13910 type:complete len:512 (-) Transcript_8713:1068-2603(-)